MNQTSANSIIRARTDAIATTTEPIVDWSGKVLNTSSSPVNLSKLTEQRTVLTGSTNATVSDAPASGEHKQTTNAVITNLDTVAHTITIEKFNGTNATLIHSVHLLAGEKAEYHQETGWEIYTPTGKKIGGIGETGAAGTAGADGALTVTEVEVDFGAVPVFEKQITVTNASITSTSKIIAVQSGAAPTGGQADENQMDFMLLNCTAGAGSFVLNVKAIPGPVSGARKINYQFS